MKNIDLNTPWVFWISMRKRRWYKSFWRSRGANSLDIQFFNINLKIGLPWLKSVTEKADINYPLEGKNHFVNCNNTFIEWNHFHIKGIKNAKV